MCEGIILLVLLFCSFGAVVPLGVKFGIKAYNAKLKKEIEDADRLNKDAPVP